MIKRKWKHKNLPASIFSAVKGVIFVLKTEKNASLIFFIGIAVIISGMLLEVSGIELTIIVIISGSVFMCEIFNTVVENILDIIKPHHDPHVKILKDVTSAAVLITSLGAVIIGVIIFTPKIIHLVKSVKIFR